MQKPKPSRTSLRTPPTSKEHRYVAAIFVDDFGISRKLSVSSASSFSKKKLAAAARRVVKLADAELDRAMKAGDRETALAIRRLRQQERAADQRIAAFFRRRIKTVEPEIEKIQHQPKVKITSRWPFREVALPRYNAVVFDSQKRRGVFMRVEYYGAKTSRPGVALRVGKYIFAGSALDEAGRPMFESNLGLSVEEALCGFDHLEQINRSAQKNAKVIFHTVLALDYRWSKEQQFQAAREWAEECFGKQGLPYAIALHAPDPDGDPRNWHAHVISSYRPMTRIGPNEWDVGEALRTDLDNPQSMQLLRENFARAMTRMSREAGQCERHTALSHAARGLPVEPQIHLGEGRTRKARAGEHVAANEENHSRVARSLRALASAELGKAKKDMDRMKRQLEAARNKLATPIKSLRVPSRPSFSSNFTVSAFPPLPDLRKVEPIAAVDLPARASTVSPFRMPVRQEPTKIPPLCSLDFANLRIPPISPQVSVPTVPDFPIRPARAFSKIEPITTIAVPKLAPQTFELSLPNISSGPVPPLVSMDEFPRPSRILEFAEQDDIAADRADAMARAHPSPGENGPRLDLEQLMAHLRKKKRLIRRVGNGFVLPADMLDDMGLDPGFLSTPDAQDALRAEHFQQVESIGPIVAYFAAKPGDLYAVSGGWRAHRDVPLSIREEVDCWSAEPRVQSALGRLSAMHDVVAGSSEYQRRIGLVHDIIYPRARVQTRPLDDTETGPRGAAVSPAETDTDPAMKDNRDPAADKTAPGPVGWPFPGSDPGRGGG